MCGGKAVKDAARRALVELEHIHISPHPKESSQESMEVGGDVMNLTQAGSLGSDDVIMCGDGARAVETNTRQELE